ncbi:hypothetical protein CJD36_011820 [Flavipsychrobacter stenotrophus]|uniref:Lipocalin-like domain-containing protein n=1 Tax=Flavipsychrobacter stenotrophus TaxID=2077091 RepID=A0A2S7SV88_9BACT|nr:lipocalin family protein [Flavipsychrobacter stenotrophus]PQJ10654.1 hypothetical protein CJD36_011820 [Flavipsychrobacter stenotrophus]
MKKAFLFGALVCAVFIANAGAKLNQPGEGGDPAPAAAPVAASIVGKWHAVDMKFEVPKGEKAPDPKEVKEMIAKQNMTYEFMADGTMKMTGDGHDAEKGTYKKVGTKLETVGPKGEKETLDITKLTDKELHLNMKKEKMTIILEKI